jgi:ABC-2 type transport system permease protein
MGNIWIIARREYKHYFVSPIAYVVFSITLLVLGGFLFLDILFASQSQQQFTPDISRTLQLYAFPMLFFAVPALTMRTVAEENRGGTLELLLTAPVSDTQLIVGKWLGSFLFFMTITLVTWIYPIILNQLVSPGIDQGILISGYLGVILLTAALCAVGVAVSSFFSNLIAAFFASFGAIIVFWVIGSPAQVIQGPAADVLRYISLTEHFYNNMLTGIVRLDDIVYYISFTIFCLFLGKLSIEMRRWR